MSQVEDNFLQDLEFKGDFKSAPNGDFALIKGIENLKQALYHRLITVPGSLVHRPGYGVGVQQFQNDVSSLPRQRQLALIIKAQFEQDARVSEVKTIKFEQSSSGELVIQYVITAVGLGDLTDSVQPFGDLTF
jgi:phage baseplate assembly protein W